MKSVKTEIYAGLTTFLTMSYIIVLNPAILSTEGTGMSFTGVMTATIMVSFLATLLMGLFAKLPFALAPGMGLNAFFTYTLILGDQIPWQQALGMVFWSGVFFVVISVTPLREHISRSIPKHLRHALAVGIGVFLAFIGFKNSLFIEAHPATFIHNAPFSFDLALAALSLFVILFFLRKKHPASFLIGILGVTVVALIAGKVQLPERFVSSPDFSSVFFKADLAGSLKWAFFPSIVTLIVTDMFDSLSTFIGVAETSKMLDKNGEPKNLKKALFVDAVATMISGLFGSSSATTYIESSAGTNVGGRTGLTAVVTALCFLPFLFLSPLLSIIPSYATGPVLIVVGFLMFSSIRNLDFHKFEDSLPAFLTILLIPLSFSITHGLFWGILAHVVLYVLSGRRKELNPILVGLSVIAILLL